MKHDAKGKDALVIGFALFSMYFGAGNVIFPPYLGVEAGTQWLIGFLGYYISDIGLALLALFSILRFNSSEEILRPIGNIPSKLLMCAIVLCIGPMIVIPRSGATTFELAVTPFTDKISPVVFSVLFFALVFLICSRKSSVVDIVGKFLTPVLLAGLILLIVKGCITPLGTISALPKSDGILISSVKSGYQTLDVLGTMMFGLLVLESAEQRGYTDQREKRRIVTGTAVIAGVALAVVYMGLTYLGATVAESYELSISRSVLVTEIVRALLGKAGMVIFAVVVALACLTTAVSLLSATAGYFHALFHKKIPYVWIVAVFCVSSAVVSNIGLDQIISIASPILDVIYPPVLVLIILSYVKKELPRICYYMATLGAMGFSIMDTVNQHLETPNTVLSVLPFSSIGCGWILPALVCGVIGYFMGTISKTAAVQENS